MAAPGNWQAVVEKVVEEFYNDQRIDTFDNLTTDGERISFIAETDVIRTVDWITEFFIRSTCMSSSNKSKEKSLNLKTEGTSFFRRKMYREAANKYSEAIMKIPWDTDDIAILYGNRSACLFYLQLYECCLDDIDQAKKCRFPEDKIHKLLIREVNCYNQLEDSIKAEKLIDELEASFSRISLDSVQKEERNKEIMKLREKTRSNCRKQMKATLVPLPQVSFGENKLLVQASQAVDIQHTEEKGRYLIASQDLCRGNTLIVERPYAAVLLPDNMHTHCHHCFLKLKLNFYPCRRCVSVKYCSIVCETNSWQSYHSTECSFLPLLHSVGIAHLSLRVVITAGLQYLKSFLSNQSTIQRTQLYKGFDETGTYSRSYQSVYDLMTHSDDMDREDLLQYTLTALLLLEILKHSGWFSSSKVENDTEKVSGDLISSELKKDKLTDDERLIGALLLRHILQLVCNAHAITELQCTQVTNSIVEDQNQVRIATAIYPTASLMNHSCDPSIIASFNKDTLVVRAVKDISKGEEVFNCYGPHHKRMSWEERQQSLQQQYFFTCQCKPCLEGGKASSILYSYRCTQCEGPVLTVPSGGTSCQSCGHCDILDLMSLRQADRLFQDGVKLLQENRTRDAVSGLSQCLQVRQKLLYKHNKVLSETQDCLARCYASLGNFRDSAKFLKQSIDTVKVIYGAESIETGNELQKLAEILISAHMWQEALDCVSIAIKIFTEHYSESHDTVCELSDMKEQLTQVLMCNR